MHSQQDELNVYQARLRRWLAEYPYPLPTSSSIFTPQEIAEALAEAYAVQALRGSTWPAGE